MHDSWRTLTAGAAAGWIGSTGQVVIGKTLEKLLLPPHENSDLAPRLIYALGTRIRRYPSHTAKWGLGTAFHYVYGSGWGMSYALLRERLSLRPGIGGALIGGLIYGITFPRWGLATLTETERPPYRRTAQMKLVTVSVAVGFGLIAAYAYEALRPAPAG